MDGTKFYLCEHCGNLVGMIHSAGVPIICCGQPMTQLVANTNDASQEKHVPVITVKESNVIVKIGSVPHPMADEHHISWVYLQTDKGGHRKVPPIGSESEVTFALTADEKPISAYAYCNLHGLWKADV